MSDIRNNIIVIGGGVGGYVAAIHGARLGAQVVLVEKDTLGGTCLNRGCIPTKALLQSADVLSLARGAETFGVLIEKASLDFSAAMKRKETVVKQLVSGVNSLMRKNKIRVVKGTGTIIDPRTVKVLESNEEVKGDSIIIATGSKPSTVLVEGINEPGVITSDEALVMEQLPQSTVVIGGGVIGLEFAQILSRMGVKVIVVEMMPQILPTEDTEMARILEQVLKEDGIEVFTGATVTGITGTKQGEKKVSFTKAGGEEERTVEKVLVAVGRCPNTDDLGIEKLGIVMDGDRIVASERMETNIPGVYAVGDVVGGLMLAHVAMAEGKCAMENTIGSDSKIDYRAVPRCVYTSPEMAGVGLTEEQANEEYQNVKVGRFPFIANGRAVILNETKGMVKIIAEAKYGQILGVQIVGSQATELIAEAMLGIQLEATINDIASSIHAHPTLSEVMMEAALGVEGKAIHI